jgi:hypothetical protein
VIVTVLSDQVIDFSLERRTPSDQQGTQHFRTPPVGLIIHDRLLVNDDKQLRIRFCKSRASALCFRRATGGRVSTDFLARSACSKYTISL